MTFYIGRFVLSLYSIYHVCGVCVCVCDVLLITELAISAK